MGILYQPVYRHPLPSGKTSTQSGICTHLHPQPSPFPPQQLGCSVVWSLLCYWVRARDHCLFFVINSCYSLGILCTSLQPRMVSFDCSIGSLKRSTKKKVNCSIMELMIVYLGCWVLVVQCLLFCVLRMVFSIVELSPVFRRAKHQDTKLETWQGLKRRCSKKNWRKLSFLNLQNSGCPACDFYFIHVRFFSHPGTIVRLC